MCSLSNVPTAGSPSNKSNKRDALASADMPKLWEPKGSTQRGSGSAAHPQQRRRAAGHLAPPEQRGVGVGLAEAEEEGGQAQGLNRVLPHL